MTSQKSYFLVAFIKIMPALLLAQPEVPVEQWTGKTYPDDLQNMNKELGTFLSHTSVYTNN